MLRILLACLLLPSLAAADVSFDGSMGPGGAAPSQPGSDGFATDYLVRYDEAIADPAARYGIRRGPNLFQSLDRLDLTGDERAIFQALAADGSAIPDLERVITRITSGDRSLIEGVLRSEIPGADLFLLNPAGIDFLGRGGNRRQLDLQGGFVASTADFLRFDDGSGTIFAVDDLEAFSLSTGPVESFGFSGARRAAVRFDRAGLLAVPEGEDLLVVAGDVTVTGFSSLDPTVPSEVSRMEAAGGSIQLAAVGEAATEVPLDTARWSVRQEPQGTLGEVTIEAFSDLRTDAAPDDQGRIVLRGGVLVVDDSRVQAGGNGPGTLALDVEAADAIVAREDARLQVFGTRAGGLGGGRLSARRVELSGSGARRTFVGPRPFGTGADPFVVEAEEIEVRGSAELVTEVSGVRGAGGPGAELRVRADSVRIADGGRIGTRALTGAAGGRTRIEARTLEIDGGAVRSDNFLGAPDGARIFGGGQAGALELIADDLVLLDGGRVEAFAGPEGDGGNVFVRSARIELRGGSEINATTINDRDAGSIDVRATEHLRVVGNVATDPTGFFADSGDLHPDLGLRVGTGDAGDIRVEAPRVEMEGQALLRSRSRGGGNPGSVTVLADELLLRGDERGAARLSVLAQDGDVGGLLAVRGGEVTLEDGAALSATTFGASPGGRIVVDADSLSIRGVQPTAGQDTAAILSDTTASGAGAGDAGEIDIDLRGRLQVTDGGEIRALTRGGGDAGSIEVDAGGSVEVSRGGRVTAAAEPGSTGEAGNVSIEAPAILIEGGSITTEAFEGTASDDEIGGNIALTSHERMRLRDGALVSASSFGSQDAGRITLDAGRSLVVRDSTIATDATVETQNAAGGQIDVFARKKVELVESTLSTSVRASEGDEDGGNVLIDPRFVIVNASDILAQAQFGDGGQIHIVAGTYLESADSLVDASSLAGGIDGVVEIFAPEVQLKGELVELPARFFDVSALLRQHCAARIRGGGSFVVAGREASPSAPDRPLAAPVPLPEAAEVTAAGRGIPVVVTAGGPTRLRLADVDCAALARRLDPRGDEP